jgi:formylmethanofuran dehydrogenase subunit E-like metal-binding protein
MNQEIKTHLAKELNLENNGVGMEAYTSSLKETLQDSMQSPSWDSANASLFSRLQSKAMNYSNENLNA